MIWALVPAAGRGRRMESQTPEVPKQYLPLAGSSVLECSLAPFVSHPAIDGIVVALADGDRQWPKLAAARNPKITTVTGGAERADSVLAGLRFLNDRIHVEDWVLVHDAARPCLRQDDLDRMLHILADDPVGGLMALPARDTLKRVSDGRSAATIDRSEIWQAQTPQMFRFGLLRESLSTALQAGARVTDEASALELAGHWPRLVEGRADNIKITVAEDLAMAELILGRREGQC